MAKKLNTTSAPKRIEKLNSTIKKSEKENDVTNFIPIDSIIFNEDNVFNLDDSKESIEELAQNIEENGLLHNIVVVEVENNKYLLISGERRTRAMKTLGKETIKATIKKDLSELEVLKMLFFANSETREYSVEEKLNIIKGFTEKLKKFENTSEKEAAQKFRQYVAQAFNVSERQAYKLISISSELIDPLKKLLFDDVIGINAAASLAQLPIEYQDYALKIVQVASENGDKKFVEAQAEDFAKRTKNIISKSNTSLAKQNTSRIYYDTKLLQAKEELAKVSDLDDSQENAEKKSSVEKNISKYTAKLEQLNKDFDVEKEKQDNEINKIFANTVFTVNKGVQEDKSGKIVQGELVAKEIHVIEKALAKLRKMKPDDELGEIQEFLDKYKEKHCV